MINWTALYYFALFVGFAVSGGLIGAIIHIKLSIRGKPRQDWKYEVNRYYGEVPRISTLAIMIAVIAGALAIFVPPTRCVVGNMYLWAALGIGGYMPGALLERLFTDLWVAYFEEPSRPTPIGQPDLRYTIEFSLMGKAG